MFGPDLHRFQSHLALAKESNTKAKALYLTAFLDNVPLNRQVVVRKGDRLLVMQQSNQVGQLIQHQYMPNQMVPGQQPLFMPPQQAVYGGYPGGPPMPTPMGPPQISITDPRVQSMKEALGEVKGGDQTIVHLLQICNGNVEAAMNYYLTNGAPSLPQPLLMQQPLPQPPLMHQPLHAPPQQLQVISPSDPRVTQFRSLSGSLSLSDADIARLLDAAGGDLERALNHHFSVASPSESVRDSSSNVNLGTSSTSPLVSNASKPSDVDALSSDFNDLFGISSSPGVNSQSGPTLASSSGAPIAENVATTPNGDPPRDIGSGGGVPMVGCTEPGDRPQPSSQKSSLDASLGDLKF